MKVQNLHANIGIPPDKDDFVIEVYTDDYSIGEIERKIEKDKDSQLVFTIYNNPKGGSITFPLDDLAKIIEIAQKELGK